MNLLNQPEVTIGVPHLSMLQVFFVNFSSIIPSSTKVIDHFVAHSNSHTGGLAMTKIKKHLPITLVFLAAIIVTLLEIYINGNDDIFIPLGYLIVIILFDSGTHKLSQPKIAFFTILVYSISAVLLLFVPSSTRYIIGSAALIHILLL